LKISNYPNNKQSYNNPFIDPPVLRNDNVSSRDKLPIFDQNIVKDIKEFLPKEFKSSNRASKSIDYSKTAIKEKEFFSISPNIEKYQSSYLANMNDYDIKEGYQVNKSRVQNFERKLFEDYNPVVNKVVYCTPDKIQKDKWGQFYENYLFLSNQHDAGFKKKKDYFTNFIDQNIKLMTKSKPRINKENNEKNEISLSSEKISVFPKKIKKYVQKSIDLSKIQEDKDEILKNNGIKLKHRSILKSVRSEKNLFQTKKIQEAIDKNNLEKIRLLISK
jgi:hypothetical protein